MRLNVKGQMYKFDFEKMEQRNLSTLETCEMRAPGGMERKERPSLFKMENLTNPLSKGRKSLTENVWKTRPVLVVRVPEGKAGEIIEVPHPQNLGKALDVAVPSDAKTGQPLFVPVPAKHLHKKVGKNVKYGVVGVGGATAGAIGTAVVMNSTGAAVGGGAAAGGAGAVLAAGAPVALGVAAVAGVGLGVGAGVHYATRNPGKAVVIGVLTLGALVAADHIAEVGVAEAAGDLVAGTGDLVEGAGDAVEDGIDAAEDAGDFFDDSLGDAVDFIGDLF
jgi:hypothetical protein